MELKNIQVDFSSELGKMAKYLILHDASEHRNLDCKIGKFMLGRATGHTKAVLQTVTYLSHAGFNVRVMHLNEETKRDAMMTSRKEGHIFKPNHHYTYNQLICNSTFHCGTGEHVDLIIFDTYSYARSRYAKLEETIVEFMHYIFEKSKGTRTGFLFIQ